jgi:hypothetical protein
MQTPAGVGATIDRMTHGEGAISELKLQHGLARARRRGTAALQLQALVAATAINLKRLLSGPGATHDARTGTNHHTSRHIRALIEHHTYWLTSPAASATITSSTAS